MPFGENPNYVVKLQASMLQEQMGPRGGGGLSEKGGVGGSERAGAGPGTGAGEGVVMVG